MLKSKFIDDWKMRPVVKPSFLFDGIPATRECGMIYWYSWGEHTFDIRVMREVLGLPVDHPSDTWFMETPSDRIGSFTAVMSQIKDAMGARAFAELMEEHDRIVEAKTWGPATHGNGEFDEGLPF